MPWVLTSRSRRNLVYHFVGIQPNEGVGREGMSGAIIGMHMHDKTSTTAQSKDRQQHSRTIKTGTSAFKRAGRVCSASLATGGGRAEEHAMISDASTVGRPRRREEGRRGREHGVGACLVRGLPEHVLSPTTWPSVRSHVSLFESAALFSRVRWRPSLAT